MIITSQGQLERELTKIIQNAMDKTKNDIFDTVKRHLDIYYGDYAPFLYQRTYAMMNSVIQLGVLGNARSGLFIEVKIDEGYLGSAYGYHEEYNPPWSVQNWTGLDAVTSAEGGMHGGKSLGGGNTAFWTNALNELGGESGIKNKLVGYLRASGLPIV